MPGMEVYVASRDSPVVLTPRFKLSYWKYLLDDLDKPDAMELGSHGFAFVVVPSTNFSDAARGRYLDLFNESDNRNPTNRIFAVEFDTAQQAILMDTDASHVAIDVNRVISNASAPAAYYIEYGKMEGNRKLTSKKIEGWEIDYPHRFSYRELYRATKGFKDELGKGVSTVSTKSVELGEDETHKLGPIAWNPQLGTEVQYSEGIASSLLYLHEEWEQVVVHRDVKASHVLLDGDLNGRLSDFGLVNSMSMGPTQRQPTSLGVSGTWRWSSPTSTSPEFGCGGQTLDAMDKKLENCYVVEEGELVLKLGVLCSQTAPE
ncbi:L-type lectin-domain containing receptor kinase IV.3, partial [Nymphaea colorata]